MTINTNNTILNFDNPWKDVLAFCDSLEKQVARAVEKADAPQNTFPLENSIPAESSIPVGKKPPVVKTRKRKIVCIEKAPTELSELSPEASLKQAKETNKKGKFDKTIQIVATTLKKRKLDHNTRAKLYIQKAKALTAQAVEKQNPEGFKVALKALNQATRKITSSDDLKTKIQQEKKVTREAREKQERDKAIQFFDEELKTFKNYS